MTFTLMQLWQMFLAMCGSVATIAGAGAIIYKIYKSAKRPDTERDETLARHQRLLENDNKRLKELEESNKIIMQSMLHTHLVYCTEILQYSQLKRSNVVTWHFYCNLYSCISLFSQR